MMGFLNGPFLGGRAALGLLFPRVVVGSALMLHGYPKIAHPFSWMGADAGMPGVLQALAATAEFAGGLGLIVGFLTPIAAFGVACTMGVAAYTHFSRGDPFVPSRDWEGGSYELAAAYLSVALLLLFAGPGSLSIDAKVFGRGAPREPA